MSIISRKLQGNEIGSSKDATGVRYYVHRRDDNKKRNFVLVNRDLAKHYPCDAGDTIKMCNSLTEKGFSNSKRAENIVVIAFAETATALGVIVANRLKELNTKNNVFVITTTREELNGIQASDKIEFEEKHSHAVEQVMYFGDEVRSSLDVCDRLVIVDDELSTGNTILNLIDKIEDVYSMGEFTRVEAWSLLNGMSNDNKKVFKQRNIRVVYLDSVNKTEIEKHADTLSENIATADRAYNKSVSPKILAPIQLDNSNIRFGVDIDNYVREIDYKADKIIQGTDYRDKEYSRIDVVGTEECIYPAIVVASKLKERYNNKIPVTCHSTTRSPIVANEMAVLFNRTSLDSIYDNSRKTYIYNMGKDGNVLVVIVTDANCSNEKMYGFANGLSGIHGIKDIECIKVQY